MNSEKSEAAYMVADFYLIHMKRTEGGFRYAAFREGQAEPMGVGSYLDSDLPDILGGKTAALKAAVSELGIDEYEVAEVGITMLAECKGSEVWRRSRSDMESLPQNDIRFITRGYDDLFRLPDGGNIVVDYPDEQFVARCKYIDPTHMYVDSTVYHICEYADMLERNGGTCRPEPEIFEDRAAWKVGWENHAVAIHADKGGWSYAVLNKDDKVLDEGILERPDLTMREAREAVMEKNGLSKRTRYRQDYDVVAEKVAAWNMVKESDIAADNAEVRSSLVERLESLARDSAAAVRPATPHRREAVR